MDNSRDIYGALNQQLSTPKQLELDLSSPDYGEFSNQKQERERLVKKMHLEFNIREKRRLQDFENIMKLATTPKEPINYHRNFQESFSSEFLSQILEKVGKDRITLRVSKKLTPSKIEEISRTIVDLEHDYISGSNYSNSEIIGIKKKARLGEILHYLASINFSYYYILFKSNNPSPKDMEISFPEYNEKKLKEKLEKIFTEIELEDEDFIHKDEIINRKLNPEKPKGFSSIDEMLNTRFPRINQKRTKYSQYYSPSLSECFNLFEINKTLNVSEYDLEMRIFILKVISGLKEYLLSFDAYNDDLLLDLREDLHNDPGKIIGAIVALRTFYDSLEWDKIVVNENNTDFVPQIMFEAGVEVNCVDRNPDLFNDAFSHFIIDYKTSSIGEKRRKNNNVKKLSNKTSERLKTTNRIPLPEFYTLEQILNNIFSGDKVDVNINDRILHIHRDIEENAQNSLIKMGLQLTSKLDMVVLKEKDNKRIIDVYDFKSSTSFLENDLGMQLSALVYRISAAMLLIGNGVNPKQTERLRYFGVELDSPELIHTILNHTSFNFVDLRNGKIISNDEIFQGLSEDDILDLIKLIYKIQEISIVYSETISKELKNRQSDEIGYL